MLAAGAVAGAAALLLTEVEALLELVGVVAAGRFLTTKLLFAKDREETISELKCVCSGVWHMKNCCGAACAMPKHSQE